MKRMGIDVGGTFTDVVLVDDETGQHWSLKTPTTPKDRVIGAVNGVKGILEKSGIEAAQIDFIGHGTTMATNMIVEHKGARTALITSRGFRDILEIRRVSRHDRADLYDLQFEAPQPLVKRRWCLEIDERIDFEGNILKPLDLSGIESMIELIRDSEIEAVAICLLHSYKNPLHEQELRDLLSERLPDRFITASCDVNPEMMEYERTSTTVMNAMLGPVCSRYIRTIGAEFRHLGFQGELMFMQSNGGLALPETVEQEPVLLLESGPAGGVSATARLAEQMNISNVLLGDMGGTTFDVSLIRNGKPELRNTGLLHSYTVRSPTIDIDSVGAGGGSIAWIDAGGGVRIGPESASADPGPACYGRGGTRATVTDCNVILGFIDPGTFLNGTFKLDRSAAERVVEEHLAKPLGVSVIEAAHTVRAIANALMAQAMRLMTVERGYDPRDFDYVCYGGAGPVHAVDLAADLEIRRVVVPKLPGLYSAFGMVVADRYSDLQEPVESEVAELDPVALEASFKTLEDRLAETYDSGLLLRFQRRVDCRYAGQPEPMTIDIAPGPLDLDAIRSAFEDEHQRHWSFIREGHPLICNNIRVRVEAPTGWKGAIGSGEDVPATDVSPEGQRRIYLDGKMSDVPVYSRDTLPTGARIQGPAVIEEPSSCLAFGAAQTAHVDAQANLIIEL
ncbi:hydantoinase/oxoprolinase family protein [Vreelandella titanicae]|uniref:hydantoinase/oxoprolinase family protein n=1 Tax=Vreelandella titanicae TaxID=664683 RepID=UPI00315A716D